MKTRLISGILACSLLAATAAAQNDARPGSPVDLTPPSQAGAIRAVLAESFENVAVGPNAPAADGTCTVNMPGWFARNNSQTPRGSCVFNPAATPAPPFTAQAGTATSYAALNFNNTTAPGATGQTISTWLISPRVTFTASGSLEFWVRAPGTTAQAFPDRLQVRVSTAADTTPDVGLTTTSVGTFSTLLLDINPTLVTTAATCPTGGIVNPAGGTVTGFPVGAWCQIRLTSVSGLPTSGSGRIAFRYFVTDGGPQGNNSNFIGIDSFAYDDGIVGNPSITLNKRVQLSTGTTNTCVTTGTSVTLPFGGGAIDYCYGVTNTGPVALITHTLVDPAFATPVVENLAFNLAPAASVNVRATKTVTQTESTGATWTACNQATNCTGAVLATASVAAGTVVAGVAEVAANAFSTWSLGLMLLAIGSIGMLAFRRQA